MRYSLITVKHFEVETSLGEGVFNMVDDAALHANYLFWIVGISFGMYSSMSRYKRSLICRFYRLLSTSRWGRFHSPSEPMFTWLCLWMKLLLRERIRSLVSFESSGGARYIFECLNFERFGAVQHLYYASAIRMPSVQVFVSFYRWDRKRLSAGAIFSDNYLSRILIKLHQLQDLCE